MTATCWKRDIKGPWSLERRLCDDVEKSWTSNYTNQLTSTTFDLGHDCRMSGLEGLAAMAAAAQVAGYGCMIALAITEMTDRLRETPQRFERYTLKLNQLRTLAQQIQDNPNLRTPVVHSYLCATLQEAEATKHILDVFLTSSRKRRYWAVISGRPHRKIIDHLDSLHHTVTELNLCISSMNTIHLGQVQSGVDRLIVIAANASLNPTAAVVSFTPHVPVVV